MKLAQIALAYVASLSIVGTMKIGVVLPTRGLIFTEVVVALMRELESFPHALYSSSDLKIPECENILTRKALDEGADYVLFIEEDTVIPEGGLKRMIDLNTDIACIDYGVNAWSCITRNKENEILWCGLGCTLVSSKVFDKLETPYFRADRSLLLNFWPEIRWIPSGQQVYGGQDIWFCMQAREKGFKILQAEGECKHLKLNELGRPEVNYGLHNIEQKPVIEKHQIL